MISPFRETTKKLEDDSFQERILKETGHVLDDKKTNIFRKGRGNASTGLVVNERPNLARPLKKNQGCSSSPSARTTCLIGMGNQ